MSYARQIAADTNLKEKDVAAAIRLLDDGNTLPFVARYRKEATGGLDEEALRHVDAAVHRLRALDERRAAIKSSVEEQGALTEELAARLDAADSLAVLEDLYQPYRPKRRTRATMAREKGLEPLAELILTQSRTRKSPAALARRFLNEEVPSVEEALAGARDIVAETVSDDARIRGDVREKGMRHGVLKSERVKKAEDERGAYQLYYDFAMPVKRLQPHQVLALNRGEEEGVLRISFELSEHHWLLSMRGVYRPDRHSSLAEQLQLACADAAARLLLPATERSVRRALTDEAEAHAIDVFATNLRALLNQPPLLGRTILGIDPAYRTGCKLAVIDPTGQVADTGTIYPHPPRKQRAAAGNIVGQMVGRHGVTLIAIGNGTASRETEQFVADFIEGYEGELQYLIVNEAGASVYSASELARAELPDLDVTLRGAVSIARRAQDPLAELVKIDPKSIGVGLYQHDVNQKALAEALDAVVESVVNRVGVDVNTASPALLTHVAGIGPTLSRRIVAHRDRHGPFQTRAALSEVSGLGPKTFEQAAGFLRVNDGPEPLDATAIHPESYDVARQVLNRAGISLTDTPEARKKGLDELRRRPGIGPLARALKVGEPTLIDIFEQLLRPGRDPREDAPPPLLRKDLLSMDDLRQGMTARGTVRNVVDFGAFVDIGVKQDGLLHRSQIPRGVTLTVGDVVEVKILKVEKERGRIGLGWIGTANV